jgi:hypothetical protein
LTDLTHRLDSLAGIADPEVMPRPPKKSSMPSSAARKSRKKSAREKLETVHESHGVPFFIPPAMQKSMGQGTMIVPRPLDVEAMMQRPGKGRLITLGQIRGTLAKQSRVDQCCPLTTGIFARLAAEAAEEDAAAGKKRITPWWRTIRDNGELNDKFPGGAAAQAARLREEGFSVARNRTGSKLRVVEFEPRLVQH